MKKLIAVTLLLALSFSIFTACKKNASELTCTLYTTPTQPPVNMTVTYTATATGDGSMASLTYATMSGNITIHNPQLPWSITVTALTSTNVSISATGTATNGSLEIKYDGTSGGSSISGRDFCQQQTD